MKIQKISDIQAREIKSYKKNINNFSNANTNPIAFKGIEDYDSYKIHQIKENRDIIKQEISNIFKHDREIINSDFTGEVQNSKKFSSLGYYLSLEKENNLKDYLKNQNLRKLSRDYRSFYDSNLKSYFEVNQGTKKYLDNTLNTEIQDKDIDKLIEKKLDDFFVNQISNTMNQESKSNMDYLKSDFAQTRLHNFESIFKENPLMMQKDNIKQVFSVIEHQLDFADKKEYEDIYENLDNLSDALYMKDKSLMLTSWENLRQSAISFYKDQILKSIVEDKNKKVNKLNNFIESPNYKILNQNNKLSILFEYRGSGELTLSEKTFLIDKYNQAQKDKKSYGVDMLDFLVNKPANNKIRKQIVKNLIESQEFAQNNFVDLKKMFVQEVNNKNYDSNIFKIKINQTNIVDLILSDMDIESYLLSDQEKINHLSKIADEDIEKSIEKYRKNWLDEKFIDTLHLESEKYDTSKQTTNIIDNLTFNVDGKNVSINEFLDNAIKNIYGQNADIKDINDKIFKENLNNHELLKNNNKLTQQQYTKLMNQMLTVLQKLCSHDVQSVAFYKQISKELDKIEMNYPWLRQEVKDTRSTLEKIRDGVFNMNNIFPATFLYKTISAFSVSGEPVSMIISQLLFILLYGTSIYRNINSEFKRN